MTVRAKKTKDYCDIQIRKCGRFNPETQVYDSCGAYYPLSSVIGLRLEKTEYDINPDRWEEEIIQTLLHEVNHWASFLFLKRRDWERIAISCLGVSQDDRLIEKIADYPLCHEKPYSR